VATADCGHQRRHPPRGKRRNERADLDRNHTSFAPELCAQASRLFISDFKRIELQQIPGPLRSFIRKSHSVSDNISLLSPTYVTTTTSRGHVVMDPTSIQEDPFCPALISHSRVADRTRRLTREAVIGDPSETTPPRYLVLAFLGTR